MREKIVVRVIGTDRRPYFCLAEDVEAFRSELADRHSVYVHTWLKGRLASLFMTPAGIERFWDDTRSTGGAAWLKYLTGVEDERSAPPDVVEGEEDLIP